jgi:hypothetical protein
MAGLAPLSICTLRCYSRSRQTEDGVLNISAKSIGRGLMPSVQQLNGFRKYADDADQY